MVPELYLYPALEYPSKSLAMHLLVLPSLPQAPQTYSSDAETFYEVDASCMPKYVQLDLGREGRQGVVSNYPDIVFELLACKFGGMH